MLTDMFLSLVRVGKVLITSSIIRTTNARLHTTRRVGLACTLCELSIWEPAELGIRSHGVLRVLAFVLNGPRVGHELSSVRSIICRGHSRKVSGVQLRPIGRVHP